MQPGNPLGYIEWLNLQVRSHNELIALIDTFAAECEAWAAVKGAKEKPVITTSINGICEYCPVREVPAIEARKAMAELEKSTEALKALLHLQERR